ncbi:hypothetical protein EK21DRAFT_68932 [Setomelanomma holmii]|uniref:Uncharacterized protein n=1 Tax=Setomelanomma holmii TaxID=210430 RepID=A0A9P4LKL0_9PLEO|nr:hypothetical protein EK21DRAFT_68932 [Setomelanomma holmii]
MLTREGFVAVDMSGQSTLPRSSWKAEAIRKGNLKISGPIPITEDTPLNEDEEEEFARTGALQSPGQPQDELDPPNPRPQTPPQPGHAPPTISLEPASLTSHPVDDMAQPSEGQHARDPSRSPPRLRQVNEIARESVVESTSYNPGTPYRSTPESATKAAQKKKRKSGLRNVFRKMFGRKSKDEPEEEEPARRGHSYHHSDPGMLRQSLPREDKTPSGPRISDLPIRELKPLHPLGQHLPFPMNVNAPQASPPHEYLTFDMQRPGLGRRATLPSVPSAGIQRHSLDEPRGRSSIWDEKLDEDPAPSPGGIGIALSSPTEATPKQHKRRSRSADALRDLVKDRASIDKRRSAEIRYWRQSYASGSIYSRPQTAKTVETIRSVQMQEPTITEPEDSVIEMSATLVHSDEPTPSPGEPSPSREVPAPVSAFNFGLKSGFSDDTTVPSEPPAPVSPPERNRNRLSVEDRIAHLEENFQSLEVSIHRLSTRNNRQTIILSDAPRNLRSRNSASTNSNSNSNSDHLPNYQSSNDTLKSVPASPILVRPGAEEGSKEKVIEKLYEALKYERSARKALEQQVGNLQHDIADLHALVNKLIASATATSPSDDETDADVWATPKEEGFGESGFFHERERSRSELRGY